MIHITDIVPQEYRARFKRFDESRMADLDMDRYRHEIKRGVRGPAFNRALDYLRPRDKERDSKYNP
jgi:hypothetical protein